MVGTLLIGLARSLVVLPWAFWQAPAFAHFTICQSNKNCVSLIESLRNWADYCQGRDNDGYRVSRRILESSPLASLAIEATIKTNYFCRLLALVLSAAMLDIPMSRLDSFFLQSSEQQLPCF